MGSSVYNKILTPDQYELIDRFKLIEIAWSILWHRIPRTH